LGKETMRPRF